MSYHLHVLETTLNETTGHHQIHARIEEKVDEHTTVNGVPETFGIDLEALQANYAGSVEEWVKAIGANLLVKHKLHRETHKEVLALRGKIIDLQDS